MDMSIRGFSTFKVMIRVAKEEGVLALWSGGWPSIFKVKMCSPFCDLCPSLESFEQQWPPRHSKTLRIWFFYFLPAVLTNDQLTRHQNSGNPPDPFEYFGP